MEGIWVPQEYRKPLREVLPIVVDWVKSERMGLHERVVSLQTAFMRTLKSWDFELNCPRTVVDSDTILVKWDQGGITN